MLVYRGDPMADEEEVLADRVLAAVVRSVDPSGTTVLALRGELDVSSAATVRDEVTAALAESPDALVFDLAGLTFMDSSGIAILLVAAKAVPVRLRRPSPAVARLIELTGLTRVLPIEP